MIKSGYQYGKQLDQTGRAISSYRDQLPDPFGP